jgi:hypothetical protein
MKAMELAVFQQGSDQQGACFFGQSAVAVRGTTLLPFGLESSDRSARAPLNIRASNDSRGTDRRMNPLAFHTAGGLEISVLNGNHVIDLLCRSL